MITLNDTDADMIANMMRDEIKNIMETYARAGHAVDDIIKLCSENGASEENVADMKEAHEKTKREYHDKYEPKIKQYQKVIELMYTGSEA